MTPLITASSGGWRRWVVPAVLAAVAAGAGGAAWALDAEPAASAVDADAATTPVLSARRVPEVVATPLAERRLDADLQRWLGSSPPDSCLVVERGGEVVFAHSPRAPLAGASTQKLLTAAGLLLAHGPDAHLE
ncbi:MAG TPA: hypothetical protein VE575_14140, partial [Acidimicrobiales bacterium]|nr:hypothetical protein [Acidimicrobiales bacterium]